MKNHKEFEQAIIKYLIKSGFPQDQIVQELKTPSGKTADLAIVDRDSGNVIGVFEVKLRKTSETTKAAIGQLKDLEKSLGGFVHKFIIFKDGKDIRVYALDQDDSLQEIGSIPEFESLEIFSKYATKAKQQKKRNEFKFWSRIIIIALSGVMVLDAFNVYKINPDRLIVIALIVALFVLPYSDFLKIPGGFEFQRTQSKKTKD